MKDQALRYLVPCRIQVGAFEEFEVPDQDQMAEADIAEVDRDPAEGWVWMVQRKRLVARRALTLMARVRRPGAEKGEDLRLVLTCEGGPSGAAG